MYTLAFLTSAKKEFTTLQFRVQKQIKEKLVILVENPDLLKNNIKVLKGKHKGKFRLRVKQYRVVLHIVDSKLIITIVRVGHRKEVY